MATVKMKKGDKYADVFDSPETIKQAQLDGYTLVETKKEEPVKKPVIEDKEDEEDEKESSFKKTSRQ